MVKRAHIGWLLSALLAGVLILIIGGTVLVHHLPRYLEAHFIPQLAEQAGIQPVSCRIRRIGINGLDVADVIIGKEGENPLRINAIRLDYSISDIFNRRINRIAVDGIELPLQFANGMLRLKGMDFLQMTPAPPSERRSSNTDSPLQFDSLAIRNATIQLDWNERRYRIPVKLDISAATSAPPFFDTAEIRLLLRSQCLEITAKNKPEERTLTANFQLAAVDLNRFADIISQVPGLRIQGNMDAEGQMQLRLDPPELMDVRADCQISNWAMNFPGIQLTDRGPEQNQSREPLRIELRHSESSVIRLTGKNLSMTEPAVIGIPRIDLTMRVENRKVKSEGLISLSIPPDLWGGAELSETLPSILLPSRVEAALDQSGTWQARIQSSRPDRLPAESPGLRLNIGGTTLISDFPSYQIVARGDRTWAEATFDLNLPSIQVDAGYATLKSAGLNLNGDSAFRRTDDTPPTPVVNLKLTASPISISTGAANFRLPKLIMECQATRGKDQGFGFSGHTTFSRGRFSNPESGLRITGISGEIPWRWPVKTSGAHGRLYVSSIRWDKFDLGSMAANLRQIPTGIDIHGKYASRLIPDMDIGFAGSADLTQPHLPRAELNFRLDRFRPKTDIDLGDFFADAKGKTVNGQVDLNARTSISPGEFTGSLDLTVADVRFNDQQTGLLATGIRGNLRFPDLPVVRSAPAQRIEVDAVQIGKLAVTEGMIDFQVEPGGALFIEKGMFRWCDGKVFSQAMRIVPGRNVYDLILFCDRLKLADLLGQIGELHAEGGGTVNGRIPIRIQQGAISFEDGFLYSTPGQGGRIRLSGADILMAGIPIDTPQFAQIDLAREALKNYDYKWVKLNLNTEEQSLLLRMQLDGKPVHPLPFVPSRNSRGFIRVSDDSPGSRFQGIGLDVNFRLPLNKILRYGGSMMELFNP